MRIALVAPLDFSVELCCKEIVSRLKKNNDLFIITDNKNSVSLNLLKKWNARVIYLKYYDGFSILENITYAVNLYKILKKNKFDLTLFIATNPNLIGPILSRLTGVNYSIISIWGLGRIWLSSLKFKDKLLKVVLYYSYKVNFILSNIIWITNSFDYNFFLKKNRSYKKKFLNTKNYIDLKKYKPLKLSSKAKLKILKKYKLNSNYENVLMVSRMIWSKGIKDYFEASVHLLKLKKKINFILVGQTENINSANVTKKELEEMNKAKNFKWVGFVKDVKKLYAMADLVVLPSYYPEGGYPRGLTEAMAMAKPIITTNEPQCRSVVEVGKNGFLVNKKSPLELANKIITIVENKKLKKSFGKYSLQKSKQFDEKKIIKDLFDEINSRLNIKL